MVDPQGVVFDPNAVARAIAGVPTITKDFTAEFPKMAEAVAFAARLNGGGNWACDVVQKGRKVTWVCRVPVGTQITKAELFQDMLEQVGYYGSTCARKAKLNGVPAPIAY